MEGARVSDIKLLRIGDGDAQELPSKSVALEMSVQTLIERHLEALLGVRFLASEYVTGKTHGGRIDTLGIDENNAPVIIEIQACAQSERHQPDRKSVV